MYKRQSCVAVAVAAVAVAVAVVACAFWHNSSFKNPRGKGAIPDFAKKSTFRNGKLKNDFFGLIAWAEVDTSLHSKVLRRGWQGSS